MNTKNNHIVIAVDGSENSRRAVTYVGRLLAGCHGFTITLVHVIHAPDEDFFASPQERERWIQSGRKKVIQWLDDYQHILTDHGIDPRKVTIHPVERDGPSLSRLILAETTGLGAGTIVVGRQGLSRREEFLFGSVSKQIVSHARNCTVWVVH